MSGAPHRLDPTGACQHAVNEQLRARGPAVPVTLPGEVPAVAVTGHSELRDFLADPRVAKNACHFARLREGGVPDGWPLTAFATVQGMTTADGEDHRRLRSLVTKAFTGRRIALLRPRIEALAGELLDRLPDLADENGVVELRRHFAYPLPMGVICELLGVQAHLQDRLHGLSNLIVSTVAEPAQVVAANREVTELLAQVVATRRADPGHDLTSALIAAREEDGDRLSEHELIGTLLLMIIAGHETTLNLITNAVRALCTHPRQLALVLESAANGAKTSGPKTSGPKTSGPEADESGTGGETDGSAASASWEDVVEETLRYDSPVSFFPFRYPTEDLTVGDTLIPRGTPVLAGYTAAGRDPRTYGPDAHRFEIDRAVPAGERHLSFGHGPHYCLGAPLARMEATLALSALFARHPRLRLAMPDGQLPPHPSFVGNSTDVLPVILGD